MKATEAAAAKRFEDIPNVGPRIAADFRNLGLREPYDLAGNDAFSLYQALCRKTGVRQDPCVLDTFMAAIDFMDGAPVRPWWDYTASRQERYPTL